MSTDQTQTVSDVRWGREIRGGGQPTYITMGGSGLSRLYDIAEKDAPAVLQVLTEALGIERRRLIGWRVRYEYRTISRDDPWHETETESLYSLRGAKRIARKLRKQKRDYRRVTVQRVFVKVRP